MPNVVVTKNLLNHTVKENFSIPHLFSMKIKSYHITGTYTESVEAYLLNAHVTTNQINLLFATHRSSVGAIKLSRLIHVHSL